MTDISPDYTSLDNKPSINGVELTGNRTTEQLGLPTAQTATNAEIDAALGWG